MICNVCNIEKPIACFEKFKSKNGKWYFRHGCKICRGKKKEKSSTDVLAKRYIVHLLKRNHVEITNELIELKRQHIVLQRTIKRLESI